MRVTTHVPRFSDEQIALALVEQGGDVTAVKP